MIAFSDDLKKELIQLAAEKEIFLEGNITKIIDTDGNEEFHSYIQAAINRDRDNRKISRNPKRSCHRKTSS